MLPNTSKYDSRLYHWLAVVGRLKPGSTRSEAQAELNVLARIHARAYPAAEKDLGFRLEPDGSVPPREKPFLMMFLAALTAVALLVLAIACGNVANLLLAQASGRQREMAVRLALGATRGQLMRQMFTECVLLALGGGLAGVALAWWATRALSALPIPAPVPLDLALSVDWRVVLYASILSLGTGLFFRHRQRPKAIRRKKIDLDAEPARAARERRQRAHNAIDLRAPSVRRHQNPHKLKRSPSRQPSCDHSQTTEIIAT